ncbi:hypothetical protein A3SI_09657 [Nitritalea halalkaliphila LW7]|uniref:Phosphoribosyl-AMP cyclohydrolase n=1 Tax=Nitritalea halalkaliphila LW7 TaxID=1189621 RepID=I5C3Q5_9BACT|nr:hypothetical protein [Nitritalea halalkaliphila]EIM76457.1 hypothetical protein A3SI_09657 [Nitritalea halalkaliphila LW7]
MTKEEILAALELWGNAVVEIGKAKGNHEEATARAKNALDTLYGYPEGEVLFKPTKCKDIQFRNTYEGALAYFVGRNPDFPEDHGFAVNPWLAVRFEDLKFSIIGEQGLVQGNYFFTPPMGPEVKVEFTFGFFKNAEGKIKINLHHSSVPFQG